MKALTHFLRKEGPTDFESLGYKFIFAALAQSDEDASSTPPSDALANVILLAPDVGKEDLKIRFSLTPGGSTSRHTTVYVARNDKALVEELFDENGGGAAQVEIVDSTFVNNAHTSLGYFYQNRAAEGQRGHIRWLRSDYQAP